MHEKHYSPRTRLLISKNGEVPQAGRGVYLRIFRDPQSVCEVIYMPADPRKYAASLYGTLHDLDTRDFDWIVTESPPSNPEWEAILDRLRRASH